MELLDNDYEAGLRTDADLVNVGQFDANGCMIWGSFEPSGSAGGVCSTTGTNKSRLYQSNYATGRANCASGFFSANTHSWARYVEFTTVVGAGTSNPHGGGAAAMGRSPSACAPRVTR